MMANVSKATTIRLGTASPATQPTTAATLALLERVARKAAAQGVDLLLLPEAFLGGYPRGATFGCAIGSRSAEGRDEYLEYFRGAVDLGDTIGEAGAGAGRRWVRREVGAGGEDGGRDGEGGVEASGSVSVRGDGTREKLEEIARTTGVFIVVGVIEKSGGSLYCSAVYVCPRLGIVGKRRKVMPTATERLVWAQGSPATLRAVPTTIKGVRINMAAAICWESYMPLLRQTLYAQNINLYLAPTADGRDTWLSLLRTIGIEGRCFVVSSNMCVREGAPFPASAAARLPVSAAVNGGDGVNGTAAAAAPASVHAAAAAGGGAVSASGEVADPPPMGGGSRRRDSVITEDGFEIALPSSHSPLGQRSGSGGSPHRLRFPRRRRKSVFDEDGNEIVLCCDDDAPEGECENKSCPRGPGAAATTSAFDATPTAASSAASKTAASGAASAAAGGEVGATGGFVSRGGSCIVGPFGDVLAQPLWEDDETIVIADVDFEDCIRGRLDLDAAGSYSRNDSFKLVVQGLDLSPLPY